MIGSAPSGGAAWLRFLEEDGGTGIRAALFLTSGSGEPSGFCFTRLDRRDRSPGPSGTFLQRAVTSLAGSLLRSVVPPPVLVLGWAAEIPDGTRIDDVSIGRLWRPVEPTGARAGPVRNGWVDRCTFPSRSAGADTGCAGPVRNGWVDRCTLPSGSAGADTGCADPVRGGWFDRGFPVRCWAAEAPGGESCARRLLDGIMARDDPLEQLERAADALAEAFSDERVRALAALSGLATVVTLSPRPAPHAVPGPEEAMSRRREDRIAPSTIHANPVTCSPPYDLTLAQRLWAVLAAPPAGRGRSIRQLHWSGELMPFQKEGVRTLVERDRLLLADDMGLGKTVQAIAALRILRVQGAIGSALVAAPASLLDQWRREIERWAPEFSAIVVRGPASDRAWQWEARKDVTLVSYDTLRSDFGGDAQASVRRKRWGVVIADEAQRIKNRNDTSDALKGLRRTRSWALTGTPVENHEEELASILEFVDHDVSGVQKRYRPGMDLFTRHRELQLRRRKDDVLDDLPPKRTTKVSIPLAAGQRHSYDKAERDGIVYLKSLGAEIGVTHVLDLVNRLKQICNADPRSGESCKLDDVGDRLAQLTAQGHRALVFSQYTNDVSGVAAAAGRLRELDPLTLTGDMSQEERTAVIDRFKADDAHKVLVLSLRAGGLGLNLQEASYVFHLDRWWNPAVERQAEDRSHRMGQTVKVNVIKYSCTGTIEERIDAILERKQALFDDLVDDVSLDLSASMNREELLGLFGLGGVRES